MNFVRKTEDGFSIEISRELLEKLGLKEGQRVEFYTHGNEIVMCPVEFGLDTSTLEEDIERDPAYDRMFRNLASR